MTDTCNRCDHMCVSAQGKYNRMDKDPRPLDYDQNYDS